MNCKIVVTSVSELMKGFKEFFVKKKNVSHFLWSLSLLPHCMMFAHSEEGSFPLNQENWIVASDSSFVVEEKISSPDHPLMIFSNVGTTILADSGEIHCKNFMNEGLVAGCGAIYGDNIFNYGDVSVGCSPTPLHIVGDFSSAPESTITPSVDPTGIATLIVSGNAFLNAPVSLQLYPEPGCYSNEFSYPVVTATHLIGSFDQVVTHQVFLKPTVFYTSSEAIIQLTRVPFTEIVTDQNAKNVGAVLDRLFDQKEGGSLGCLVMSDAFLFSQKAVNGFLNTMQPSMFKGLTISQENNAVIVEKALEVHMETILDSKHCFPICRSKEDKKPCSHRCPFEKQSISLWIDGLGDLLQQKTVTSSGSYQAGYTTKTAGFVMGLDGHFANYFYLGALGAYTGSNTNWRLDEGKGSINSGYGGLYFSTITDLFYANLSLIGAWNHFTGHRNIFVGNEEFTANHDNGGSQLLSHIDTGLNFHYKGFAIRPFDSFDYVSQKENRYQETGAYPFNLKVDAATAILIRNELGLQLASCLCTGVHKISFAPKISWIREVRVKGSSYKSSFVEEGDSFTSVGYFPNRSLVAPGILISSSHYDHFLTFDLYYDAQIGHKYLNQNYGGEIAFGF